jgi:hypothetical protein
VVTVEIGVIPLVLPSMAGSLLLESPSAGWDNTSAWLGVALVFVTFLELACSNLTSTCVITASGWRGLSRRAACACCKDLDQLLGGVGEDLLPLATEFLIKFYLL